jgi:alanyl-tRNA synthetase
MTEKLYWKMPYETKFTAKVSNLKKNGIILDKTLFYPESGNQLSDRGNLRINNADYKIEKVTKEDEEILHHISSEFKDTIKKGYKVEGEIDWKYRYGLMKTHTSQHVFSAILKNTYDIDTNRAILSFEEAFLQISQKINYDELKEVLCSVNEIFTSKNSSINTKVIPYNQAKEKASEIRSQIPNESEIRLIEIENLDLVCCGGTHVQNTTEIGKIFIYDFKKGIEIKYYIGKKALLNSSTFNVNSLRLSNNLNIPLFKIQEILEKRVETLENIQNQQKELSYNFLEAISKSPTMMIKDINLFFFDFEIDIKVLNKSLDFFPQNSVIIGNMGNNKIRILSLSEKIDAKKILQEIIQEYNGKGGGNAKSAQAALNKMPKDLLSEVKRLINKELGVK